MCVCLWARAYACCVYACCWRRLSLHVGKQVPLVLRKVAS